MIPGANAPLTMSSLEIAELTGKQHGHVMRDIRSMLAELMGDGHSKFGGTYQSEQGKELPCFHLPKRECLILVSGYDIKLRARIIDRWQELEAKASAPAAIDLSDPKVLLAYLETNTRALVQANERLAIVEPKAAALDVVARHQDQTLALREVEAGVFLTVLGDVLPPKFGGYSAEFVEHRPDVAHDMVMPLPGQFGYLEG